MITREDFQKIAFVGIKVKLDDKMQIFQGYKKCQWQKASNAAAVCQICKGQILLSSLYGTGYMEQAAHCYTDSDHMHFDLWLPEEDLLDERLFEI